MKRKVIALVVLVLTLNSSLFTFNANASKGTFSVTCIKSRTGFDYIVNLYNVPGGFNEYSIYAYKADPYDYSPYLAGFGNKKVPSQLTINLGFQVAHVNVFVNKNKVGIIEPALCS